MPKLELIPIGTLLIVSTGEYSDHAISGIFRVIKPLDPNTLQEEWFKRHPKQNKSYHFEPDSFLSSLHESLEALDYTEWNLTQYSSPGEMWINKEDAYKKEMNMTRHTWPSIYERELQKLLNQGMPENEATCLAQDNADEIYYELVDRGRQEAKDGEGRYSHRMQDKGGDNS